MLENVNNRKKSFKYFGFEDNYETTDTTNRFSVSQPNHHKSKPYKTASKYDSQSDIFKPNVKSHNSEFDYPLLSSRSKYNNFTGLGNSTKYLPNSKSSKKSSNDGKKLKNESIWGMHDPYHSLANEQLAKDYLNKNVVRRSDEKAVEKIILNLEKEKKASQQEQAYESNCNQNTHNTKNIALSTTSEDLVNNKKTLNIFNSVSKWSSGLNKSLKELRPFYSLNDSIQTSRSIEQPVTKLSKAESDQTSIDKSTTKFSSQANNINTLFDILEKEGTNFTIKSGYDTPVTCQLDRDRNSISPHNYLEMNKPSVPEPDLYNCLEYPSQINIYSELDTKYLSDFYRSQTKAQGAPLIRPMIHMSRPKAYQQRYSYSNEAVNGGNLKVYQKHLKKNDMLGRGKSTSNSIMSFDTELNDENEQSRTTEKPKPHWSKSSLNSNSLTSFSNKDESACPDLNISQLVNVTRLPFQTKKGLAKIIKIKPSITKPTSPVKAKPSILGKKMPIKEFKSCILTDSKIGEGEFSELFQAYRFDLANPTKIAAKRLKCNDNRNSINILSEISVLSQLGKHQNVIEFLGVYSSNNIMHILFEFAEHGDLKGLLDRFRKNNMNSDVAVDMNFQIKASIGIASGMEYISALDIVHKDLAARNILVDNNFICKISDFGSCNSSRTAKRPIRWMAPESLIKSQFTNSSDVWSFGVVLWEIYTYGMTPYPGMTDEEVIERINQWYRLYKPQECPNMIYDLMVACWKEYHKARPRFTYIKNKLNEIYKSINGLQQNQLINESLVQSQRIFT